MKGANRHMKILLVVFREKKFIWGYLTFLAFRPFCAVWLGMVKLGQATVNWILKQDMISFIITTESWNSRDMIRIFKQSRHDFSGKNLCDGYCMDIMWCSLYFAGFWNDLYDKFCIFFSNCSKVCSIFLFLYAFMFKILSILVTLIKFKMPFKFLFFYLIAVLQKFVAFESCM